MNKKRKVKTIERYLKENNIEKIKNLMQRLHPLDAADIIAHLADQELIFLFQHIDIYRLARICEEFSIEILQKIISLMPLVDAAHIIELMRSDKIARFISAITPEQAASLKEHMTSEHVHMAYQLLQYPKESAGAIMSMDYISVHEDETIAQVLKTLRTIFSHLDTQRANYVYVVNGQKFLTGVLQMRDLVMNDHHKMVKHIMRTSVISVDAAMDQETVAQLFKKYNLLALPVIAKNGRMLGVITADSIISVIEKEMSEDLLKMSGISSGDETHAMPLFHVMRRRLSWLTINIVLNIVAASVIVLYQDTLQTVIALAVFLPIISDMSGCSGMQAVVVSVRELVLEKIDFKDFKKVLFRELIIGFVNGLVLGLEIGIVAYVWKGIPGLGLVVSLALWINTILAVCLGSILPLILKRFKLDPAIASGPVLTTVTDMMGFFLIFFLATRFMWLLV